VRKHQIIHVSVLILKAGRYWLRRLLVVALQVPLSEGLLALPHEYKLVYWHLNFACVTKLQYSGALKAWYSGKMRTKGHLIVIKWGKKLWFIVSLIWKLKVSSDLLCLSSAQAVNPQFVCPQDIYPQDIYLWSFTPVTYLRV